MAPLEKDPTALVPSEATRRWHVHAIFEYGPTPGRMDASLCGIAVTAFASVQYCMGYKEVWVN